MNTKSLIKFLSLYFFVFYFLVFIVFSFLKNHQKKNYSEENLENLLTGYARWRDKTDDPCKYAIAGDPINSGDDYVKVNFHCGKKTSTNSFSLRTMKKNKTYENILKEIARINGFDDQIILAPTSRWICYTGDKKIDDYSIEVHKKETIDCSLDNGQQ